MKNIILIAVSMLLLSGCAELSNMKLSDMTSFASGSSSESSVDGEENSAVEDSVESSVEVNREPGETVILGTYTWDADSNRLGNGKESDVYWKHSNSKTRYLVPQHGATIAVVKDVKYEDIDKSFVEKTALSDNKLNGSDNSDELAIGTIVVFKTSDGNYGKFIVVAYRNIRDIDFKEAQEKYSDSTKKYMLRATETQKYHLQIKWELF